MKKSNGGLDAYNAARALPQAEVGQMVALHKSGASLAVISKFLGRSVTTVQRTLRRLGLITYTRTVTQPSNPAKKVCTHCRMGKDATKENFRYEWRDRRFGLKSWCRECERKYQKNRPHLPTKIASENYRRYRYKYQYGITTEDYEAMYKKQGGVCGLCGGLPNGQGKIRGLFHVDHDHKTGRARGLLCGKCNIGVGCLNDDATLLRKAAAWVEQQQLQPQSDEKLILFRKDGSHVL